MTKIEKLTREINIQINNKFKSPKSPKELISMAGMGPDKFPIDKTNDFKNYCKSNGNARICKIMRFLELYARGLWGYNPKANQINVWEIFKKYITSMTIFFDEDSYLDEVKNWSKDNE